MSASNVRLMPPAQALAEAPDRLGMRVTFVYLAAYADLTKRMERLGLSSPSRIPALFHISAHPGCSQSALARFTGLSRASAMTMTNQLEGAGLIERRDANGRTNALYLTERGKAVLEEIVEETAANEQLIFGSLTKEEREAIKAALEKVILHVEARRGRSGGRTSRGGSR
jgi:DNA-binding MarR family transcriptional regulator